MEKVVIYVTLMDGARLARESNYVQDGFSNKCILELGIMEWIIKEGDYYLSVQYSFEGIMQYKLPYTNLKLPSYLPLRVLDNKDFGSLVKSIEYNNVKYEIRIGKQNESVYPTRALGRETVRGGLNQLKMEAGLIDKRKYFENNEKEKYK